jgi:AcrR family transcriptional regulator
MSVPPAPQSRATSSRDRDAYFAAASELLVAQGYEALTVAALCDRLGVTKGSFYYHFADMPQFVAAFAERWQAWMESRAQEYASITDPLLRLEEMQNDLPDVLFGADQAIRVWGRTDPVLGGVLEHVQRLVEGVISETIGQILGDPEFGVLFGRMSYCGLVGMQLRLEQIEPERYLTACWEGCRRLGIGVELVHVDGRLRTKFTHGAEVQGQVGWRKPDLTGIAATKTTRPSGGHGPAERAGRRDRGAFFAAAWELLARRGFDSVTLLAMCDRLSVTKGSFQHHFGSMPQFVAALAADWERKSNARLDGYRAEDHPMTRLSRMYQQLLGGPDPAGSAWRAWGHVEPVVGEALKRVDRSYQDLLADTLAELWDDRGAAEALAELTVALLIGLKQPRPGIDAAEAAWMALEWARRILRVDADLYVDRGRVALVIRQSAGSYVLEGN